ncbi:MAG: hypothetical protein AB7N71_03030 [Phycisphaerae bacterium]
MGFASGAISYRRYIISGKPFGTVTDEFVAALNNFAIGNQGSSDPSQQIGWIGSQHIFDRAMTGEKIALGRYAHFSLRVDKLSVPSNVARSLMRMEEEAALAASGREFLSKTERRTAREAAKLQIEKETKSGTYRRIAAYPLLIDLESNTLLFANTSAATSDTLIELFGNTFQRALHPMDADSLAERLLEKNSRALEQVRPVHFVPMPEDFGDPGTDAANVQFLGKEFLTWLWFLTDRGETEKLQMRNGDDLTVAIDRTLRLECDFRMTGTDVITCDAPGGLPEARAALAIGKQPTKAGLVLGTSLGEFALTLDGQKMNVSGLIVPTDDDQNDPQSAVEDRFEHAFDCATIIDVLYETFLQHRVSNNWQATMDEMSAWARGGVRTPKLIASA